MELSFKEINMLYHTNIRNVGLFTSISLAFLAQSRYFRKNNDNTLLILFLTFTLLIQIISLLFVLNMLSDHKLYYENLNENEQILLEKWYIIPNIFKLLIPSLILVTCYRLVNLIL